jgi:chromate transporter
VVPFGQAVRAWFAISLQTFGGPAGQIAVMQRALVEERRWIGPQRFLHALNYCMLLPDPEAQQLAVYIGWLLNGLRGGLAAGILFVVPGMAALLALSAIYVAWGDATAVTAIFAGLAPAVVTVVAQAVLRVGARALSHPALLAVAVGAFLALALFGVPFPLVVAAAAGIGWLLGRFAPHTVSGHAKARHDADGPPPLIPDQALHTERPSLGRTARILIVGLLVWAAPLAAVAVLTGTASTLTTQGLFFSGTALVTFGGAYAVLAYVAQRAVETYGWLSPGEMVRGLALAETTPGPLIMVVQFVAFLGAYHHPDPLTPWTAALVGALLTTWVTFVPCFLFIFLGAPYVERLRGNHTLGRPDRDHCCRRRGDRQPRPVLRRPHPVCHHPPAALGATPVRVARAFQPAAGSPGHHRRRAGDDLSAALVRAAHPGHVRRAWPGRSPDRPVGLLSTGSHRSSRWLELGLRG